MMPTLYTKRRTPADQAAILTALVTLHDATETPTQAPAHEAAHDLWRLLVSPWSFDYDKEHRAMARVRQTTPATGVSAPSPNSASRARGNEAQARGYDATSDPEYMADNFRRVFTAYRTGNDVTSGGNA